MDVTCIKNVKFKEYQVHVKIFPIFYKFIHEMHNNKHMLNLTNPFIKNVIPNENNNRTLILSNA